jgi:hypothetical protein
LKLGDKSGLNKKSTINDTNVKFDGNLADELQKVPIQFRKFYSIFWNNIQYLSNPLNLLGIKPSITSAQETETEIEGRGGIDYSSKFNLIKSFFESYKPLLEYFKSNPIDTNEDVTKRFPKYIRDPQLFAYQM